MDGYKSAEAINQHRNQITSRCTGAGICHAFAALINVNSRPRDLSRSADTRETAFPLIFDRDFRFSLGSVK